MEIADYPWTDRPSPKVPPIVYVVSTVRVDRKLIPPPDFDVSKWNFQFPVKVTTHGVFFAETQAVKMVEKNHTDIQEQTEEYAVVQGLRQGFLQDAYLDDMIFFVWDGFEWIRISQIPQILFDLYTRWSFCINFSKI